MQCPWVIKPYFRSCHGIVEGHARPIKYIVQLRLKLVVGMYQLSYVLIQKLESHSLTNIFCLEKEEKGENLL